MARRLHRDEITIKEEDINIKDILKDEEAAPEMLIAASIILDDQIESLKACSTVLDEKIKNQKYDDIVKRAKDEGKLQNWKDEPEYVIETRYGGKIRVRIAKGEDDGFQIDKKLSEKSTLDSVVPDRYKKVSVLLDKKEVEKDFNAGTLPPLMKSYCSKSPFEFLKVRKTVEKENS